MEELVALCRRRGFIFQSSEIYGGINGFWDYGPLGVELKKNIKEAWWQDMVRNPPPGPDGQEVSMVGVDCSIIMNKKVWKASGHVGGFSDPMQTCRQCKKLFRADQVEAMLFESEWARELLSTQRPLGVVNQVEFDKQRLRRWAEKAGKKLAPGLALVRNLEPTIQAIEDRLIAHPSLTPLDLFRQVANSGQDSGELANPCPACGGDLTEPRAFNLMFETHTGAIQDDTNLAYLRPETAQGIFVNFKNVLDSTRLKVPFGIAQIGKAFRNEINPRNYTFRSREFEQMEIEFFCHPSESMKWYQWWRDVRVKWYSKLGIKSEKLRPREQGKEELAHYSIGTTDIEFIFPFAEEPQELEGVAHRGAFDLTAHMTASGADLSYLDEEAWEKDKAMRGTNSFKEWVKKSPPQADLEKYKFIPHVIEPSAGADRFTLAVLCEAFCEDEIGGEKRTVMKFHPRLAPIKAAVFPLVNKDGMPEKAEGLYRDLKKRYNVFFDDKGAVGRRYRRQDEAGTPFCITIDGQTMQDDTVTIRERDSTVQRRIPIRAVAEEIGKGLE
jgi:glycyl-tRNA synthetase